MSASALTTPAKPAPSSPWPQPADTRLRVLAWPTWRDAAELEHLTGPLARALAEQDACLWLRHDPAIDGPIEQHAALIEAAAAETTVLDGPLSDGDWDRLAAAVSAKARPMPHWADDERNRRLDRLHVRELATPDEARRLLARDARLRPLDRWRMEYADVPGWFNGLSVGIWDSLLRLQAGAGVRGRFLEIGVWMGRSALLSALHASPDEECVLVDPVIRPEARRSLEAVHPENLRFIEAPSRALTARSLPGADRPSYRWRTDDGTYRIADVPGSPAYRWIHIDGEHTAISVAHDLAIAAELLGERGVICVDDFFAPAYPQITFAVLDYLRANPRRLMLFLCGCNKGYLCNPADSRWLFAHVADQLMADLAALGLPKATLFKTTDPIDLNCFGITTRDHWGDVARRGPDWAQDEIRF